MELAAHAIRSAVFGWIALSVISAEAGSAFDGVYQGGTKLIGGTNITKCGTGGKFRLHVKDGTFLWRLPDQTIPVKVASDGGFDAANGKRVLTGRIADGEITAQSTGPSCIYGWALNRHVGAPE